MIAYLFYLLVALFPFGVIPRITILPSVIVSVVDVVVCAILVLSAPLIWRTIKQKNTYVFACIAFIVISVLGVLTHTRGLFELMASVSYLLRLMCYLLLVIPLIHLPKPVLSKLKIEVSISGFVFVILGYIQYAYYPSLRNLFYLGWDEHLYRLFSTLLDPNFAGVYIVLIMLSSVATIFPYMKRASMKKRIIASTLLLALIPAFFLTYSRSSYIAALISFLIFLILVKQKKVILLLAASFLIALLVLPKGMGGEGVKLLRTASVIARLDTYNNILKVIYDNPLIGVGFNSLRFVSRNYGFVSVKDSLVSHSAAGVPNSYLVLLATTGIAGVVAFIVFLTTFAKDSYKLYKNKKVSLYAAGVMSSAVAILVHSLFENTLFYAPVLLWMVVITGILFGMSKKS